MIRNVVFVVLLISGPALALQPLASADLMARCDSAAAADREVCRSWAHGFVAGAYATNVARQADKAPRESFSDRAARTRVARGRSLYGRDVATGYCIPSETTADVLVEKLRAHAQSLSRLPEHANQLMLGMLRKEFPCPADKPKS